MLFLTGFNNFFLTFALNMKKGKENSLKIRSTSRTLPWKGSSVIKYLGWKTKNSSAAKCPVLNFRAVSPFFRWGSSVGPTGVSWDQWWKLVFLSDGAAHHFSSAESKVMFLWEMYILLIGVAKIVLDYKSNSEVILLWMQLKSGTFLS